MKKTILFSLLTLCLFAISACQQEGPKNQSKVTLSPSLKDFKEAYQLAELTVTFKEVNSGKSYEAKQQNGKVMIELPFGLYNINAMGTITYSVDGKEKRASVVATRTNETINTPESNITLDLLFSEQPDLGEGDIRSLVIAEIFPSGTLTPSGDKYIGDQYFRIYNNSDKVVYADSLLILESSFNTILVQDIEPKLTETCFPVQAVYMIPGNGKDVPVQPGGYLTICDQAANHKSINKNSIDLSKADFEWYDETPANSRVKDVDNPAKNLEKIYCYTRTIWSLHDRGGSSYAIAKMKTTKEDYLANYKAKYIWKFQMPDGTIKNIDKETYFVPTDWVIDGVNLSILSLDKWLVMPIALDRGFTYISTIDRDPQRYGKSVLRKTGAMKNGIQQLVDTNNSTEDFAPQSKASLL
jgi:putative lipoprotein